jgi:hypothetical protein
MVIALSNRCAPVYQRRGNPAIGDCAIIEAPRRYRQRRHRDSIATWIN